MKISYAITVCNELDEVTKLLNFLIQKKRKQDEIVVLFDKGSGTAEVWDRLQELKGDDCCTYHAKTFKKHFADWKNHLTTLCSGDYIFQIDADEMPHSILIEALPELYKDLAWEDPETNLIWIPNTINLPESGMVFANGASKNEWSWAGVKAVELGKDETAKVEGQTHKMDMSTLKSFPERDYMEALSYIGVLPE